MAYTTLIQPDELAALLPDAIVCDCSFDLAKPAAGLATYNEGHIPGAAYLSLDTVLSGPKTGLNGRHPLPSPDALAETMAALGASAGSQVVAYDAVDGMFAARLWWLLRWIGHAEVAVLDGGLAAWKRGGHPVEGMPPPARLRGVFVAREPLVASVDYAGLQADVPGRVVVDARAPDRFRGENETLDAVGGHIPGARNRFFRDNLAADGRFKPAAALREGFDAVLGGTPPADMVASCGSGVTAAHNLLAMAVAGLPGAALYPGSWSEWSAQPGARIATGS